MRLFIFYSIHLLSWLLLFGTSIVSSWPPSSWVSAIYWYKKKYGLKVFVISFSFYSIKLLSWLLLLWDSIASFLSPSSRVSAQYWYYKITVWCISSRIWSIDLQWFRFFIMFYFKLTNVSMDKWLMVKWCNSEINVRIGDLVKQHMYLIFDKYTTT